MMIQYFLGKGEKNENCWEWKKINIERVEYVGNSIFFQFWKNHLRVFGKKYWTTRFVLRIDGQNTENEVVEIELKLGVFGSIRGNQEERNGSFQF
jgi:hypothetical protein